MSAEGVSRVTKSDKEEFVVTSGDIKEYDGRLISVLYNGKCPYTKKTKAQFLDEGYKVISYVEFEHLESEYERTLSGNWTEITEQEYYEHLNVLPPLKFKHRGFFSPEAIRGCLHDFYQECAGKFYHAVFSIFTSREDIDNALTDYLIGREN